MEYDISYYTWIDKKNGLYKMYQYFPKPSGEVKVDFATTKIERKQQDLLRPI